MEESPADPDPTQPVAVGPTAVVPPGAMVAPPPGYVLEAEIGSGGSGVVYRVRHTAIGRAAALKVLRPGLADDPYLRRRFQIEAEALGRHRHPNAVELYEYAEVDGRPYVLMELVPGPTLRGRKPTAPAEAARLVAAVARAVHAAHLAGVLHLDLKPSNVLLAPGDPPVPKVTDFGMAKLTAGGTGDTDSGSPGGTPGYMAPEQSATGPLGPWSDVYGLGGVLFELLTGRKPHGQLSAAAYALTVLNTPAPPATAITPGVPADLAAVAAKCLERDPRDRYPSAEAVADDLDRFRAGRPVLARPVPAAVRAWRAARRNPLAAGLLAGLVGVTLAGGVTGWVLYRRAERERLATAAALAAEADARQAAEAAARAEKQAQERAAVLQSDVISRYEFLVELMAVARRQGGGPVVVAALKEVAREAERRHAGDPRRLNRVRLLAGQRLVELGDVAAAEPLFRAGLANGGHRLIFGVDLGRLLLARGKFDEAERLARPLIGEAEAAHGPGGTLTLNLRLVLAAALWRLNWLGEAAEVAARGSADTPPEHRPAFTGAWRQLLSVTRRDATGAVAGPAAVAP